MEKTIKNTKIKIKQQMASRLPVTRFISSIMQDKKPETSSLTVKQISYGSAAYSLFALHYITLHYM